MQCVMQFIAYIYKSLRMRIFFILILYVDDILMEGLDMKKINDFKKMLVGKFFMKDLGEAK